MDYYVHYQNKVLKFKFFFDAWLYCNIDLDLKSFAVITCGDERWTINPRTAN